MSEGEEQNYHIRVVGEEGSEDVMEFPKELDDTVLLSTLQSHFPHAIGLKYRGSSGVWRALSANNNVFAPPREGWGDVTYCVTVLEKKRKSTRDESGDDAKRAKRNLYLEDLGVMNMPFDVTESDMKQYFEQKYGELEYCELKLEKDSGKSRGYGFIRFKEEESAVKAVGDEHYMKGRQVHVRLKQEKAIKLFVGRLTQGTTAEDLLEHFSEYGDVKDTYVPEPFRNFGFVTFSSSEDGKRAMRETHHLKGSKLNVEERNADTRQSRDNNKSNTSSRDNNYTTSQSRDNNYTTSRGGGGGNYNWTPTGGNRQPQGGKDDSHLKSMLLQVLHNA